MGAKKFMGSSHCQALNSVSGFWRVFNRIPTTVAINNMTDQLSIFMGAVQVVCHLVALRNTTNSAVTESPPQYQATNELPCGYFAANSSIGVAWKYRYQTETLLSAMNVCRQEGAQLVVIDTSEKVEVIKGLRLLAAHVHAGLIRLDGTKWINVNTESTISSPAWKPDWAVQSSNCMQFYPPDKGLTNYYDCESLHPFLCELPIPSNTAIAV